MIDHLPHGTIILVAACGLVVTIVDSWTLIPCYFQKKDPGKKHIAIDESTVCAILTLVCFGLMDNLSLYEKIVSGSLLAVTVILLIANWTIMATFMKYKD